MEGWIVAGILAGVLLTLMAVAAGLDRANERDGFTRRTLTLAEWRKIEVERNGVEDEP